MYEYTDLLNSQKYDTTNQQKEKPAERKLRNWARAKAT